MENKNKSFKLFSLLQCCVLTLLIASTTSCSLTKNLPENEDLFLGTKFKFQDKSKASSVENFKLDLEGIKYPKTVKGLGNIYLGLYNIYSETPDEGFRHWVKYKLGKKPVYFNNNFITNTEAKLDYYLKGKGFFSHQVACDTTASGRTVRMTCNITLGERYTIDSLIFPVDSTYLALELDQTMQNVILEQGMYYDRQRLDYERARLSTMANNIGFADFGQENVYYYIDTTKANNGVDVYLNIIQPSDSTYHQRYSLDSINIYPNYSLDQNKDVEYKVHEIKDSVKVYEFEHYLNHAIFDRVILEKTGENYNRTLESKSINRLLDLGLFRYVNIENTKSRNDNPLSISQNIYLTPEKMQLVSGEIELNNRSGNFFGTGASAKYKNLNLFGNAELFNLTLSGQIEAQFGDGLGLINSSDVNLNAELIIPKIIVPFVSIRESRQYIPRTNVNANYTYQRRIQFYTLQSASGKFGYNWKDNARNQHELYPLSLNQVLVRNKSDEFKALLEEDVRLSQSFNDVMIAGLQYAYIYSNQINRDDRKYKYFKVSLESSGNLIGLILNKNQEDKRTIFGMPFAQFTKLTLDYRRYFPINDADLATRIIVGGGLAYDNSTELPYIKQFLIGGSNSIRAFRLRGLGPGSFVADPSEDDEFNSQFVDQTGDLKLEVNAEYRFSIFSFLKGALFIDAGNIWLINNEEQPSGNFSFNDFYKQIGVGTGFGTRLDFDFFLIRLDIAFPLRAPAYEEGFNWVVKDVNPISKSWRQDNLIYNLGIGYPF